MNQPIEREGGREGGRGGGGGGTVNELGSVRNSVASQENEVSSCSPGKNGVHSPTLAEDGSHLIHLFLVHILALPNLQLLDELLRSVSQETSHPVHHPHALPVVRLGTPDLLEHLK